MPDGDAPPTPSNSTAASFDHYSSGLKNCAHILFALFIAIGFLTGWLQKKTASALDVLQEHGVSKFEYDKLKIEFQAVKAEKEVAQKNIEKLVNNPAALSNVPSKAAIPQDVPPNTTIASALSSLEVPGSFWVYLGQYQNGHYLRHPNFETQGIPNMNDELKTWTDTYKRSALPVKTGPDNWKLGEIVGVIKEGQRVRVHKVDKIEDENYWLQVTSVSTLEERERRLLPKG